MRKGKRCLVSHGRQSDQELKAEPEAMDSVHQDLKAEPEATDSADYILAPPRLSACFSYTPRTTYLGVAQITEGGIICVICVSLSRKC